jgi:hypothetical protein
LAGKARASAEVLLEAVEEIAPIRWCSLSEIATTSYEKRTINGERAGLGEPVPVKPAARSK